MKTQRQLKWLSILALSLLIPAVAHAGALGQFGQSVNNAITFGANQGLASISFEQLIINVGTWLLGFIATIAMAAIVFGGFMYIVALGDEARVARAKRIILFAIIGLVIAILNGLIALTLCAWLDISCGSITSPVDSFETIIVNIGNFLLGLVAMLTMLAIVVGGIMYITALGDEARVARAKRILLGAAIGATYAALHVIIVLVVCQVIPGAIGNCTGVGQLLGNVILTAVSLLLAIVAPVAVGVIVYAAWLYVTAQGQEEQAARAKRVLLYAVIGLGIVAASGIIVNILIGVFTS